MEGASAEATRVWASIGNWGENTQAERDLFRWVDLTAIMRLEPYVVWLPRAMKNDAIPKLIPTPILCLHDILHSIYYFGEKQWIVSMMGTEMQSGLDEFWDMSSGEDWFKDHPWSAELQQPVVFDSRNTEAESRCRRMPIEL